MNIKSNIKYGDESNKQSFASTLQHSKRNTSESVGISEKFCDEFHKVVQAANLEIKNGKKPKFVKIA